jgi:hypothetical protein
MAWAAPDAGHRVRGLERHPWVRLGTDGSDTIRTSSTSSRCPELGIGVTAASATTSHMHAPDLHPPGRSRARGVPLSEPSGPGLWLLSSRGLPSSERSPTCRLVEPLLAFPLPLTGPLTDNLALRGGCRQDSKCRGLTTSIGEQTELSQ